jgi:hypothetical protein
VLKRWLEKHPDTYFNKDSLKAELQLSDEEWTKTYRCMNYWRDKFRQYIAFRFDRGLMDGDDPHKLLEVAYQDFETEWGMHPFYSDGAEYYVPDLIDKRRIDNERAWRKVKGLCTVASEMQHCNVTLPDGSAVDGLLSDLNQIQKKLRGDHE